MELSSLSLSEALNRFVVAKKNGKKVIEGHQELWRFVAWCGRERRVSELSPAEVAEYAQYAGQGGADSIQRLNPVKVFLTYLKEEGWVETGLAAHLRVPRARRNGGGRRSAQSEGTQLSQEGYERLAAQLEMLKEERIKVVDDIKLAMADKDFRENSPLDAAKERQGIIESRIRELESSLSNAQILDISNHSSHQRVMVGTRVALREVTSGKQVVYTLVDVREADVAAGKISNVSPVGQALLDRTVGDEVVINVPRGTLHYKIEKING